MNISADQLLLFFLFAVTLFMYREKAKYSYIEGRRLLGWRLACSGAALIFLSCLLFLSGNQYGFAASKFSGIFIFLLIIAATLLIFGFILYFLYKPKG